MGVAAGWIVILNGMPRSGKSSIAQSLVDSAPKRWVNLGVDLMASTTPAALMPGIGLRPGGERPDLEDAVADLYVALFDSVAATCRLGFDVAVDVGIHDDYSKSLGIWRSAARLFDGLPVLVVGVRCPLAQIMERLAASPAGVYVEVTEHGPVPPSVTRWAHAVHRPGFYDVEVDTSVLTPEECADVITWRLQGPATALGRMAAQA